MSNQGERHASAQGISGFVGDLPYNEAFLRMFDTELVPAGTFNERLLMWINARLATTYTSLPEAQNAFAVSVGRRAWDDVGTFV